MTQEEYKSLKELLLKDLCARLPYGVIGQCEIDASYDTPFETKLQTRRFNAEMYGLLEEGLLFVTPLIEDQDLQEFANEEVANGVDILDFKPYLFPLSSLTEEMMEELNTEGFFKYDNTIANISYLKSKNGISKEIYTYVDIESTSILIEFFNSHHIDYRGLIEKGLAIDATGLNIYC